MDLILCHQTADFDSLGAAIGLTKLKTGAKVVLTGGAHPGVKDFLALYRDEFDLIERRSVDPQQIRSLIVVDTQKRDRLGKATEWFDLPSVTTIEIYDHHVELDADIPATSIIIEPVGAATTLIVEKLQTNNISLNFWEATVMALGIHVDTGSLTFENTTSRDAQALAWLLAQGAIVSTIAEYVEQGLSPQLQQLLSQAWEQISSTTIAGYTVAWLWLETDDFVPGLSSLAQRLLKLSRYDALLLAHQYHHNESESKLALIGRSRIPQTNLHQLFEPLGGGGHPQAAAVNLRRVDGKAIFKQLKQQLIAQIPQPVTARDLMSSPVRTIRPHTTITEAQRILLRYGHSGLSVVNEQDELVGIISRRDLDLALHHGFSHAPVKGYMSRNLKTITPQTFLPEIESLMVTYDVGRLPVLQDNQLLGIVTRTDVLRQRHQEERGRRGEGETGGSDFFNKVSVADIQSLLNPQLWHLLSQAAEAATQRGWNLYLVGGAVRDLLLAQNSQSVILQDIDMVVDGFHRAADVGAGVELAKALQKLYPGARLEVHGAFQTAALLWHKDSQLGSLWMDIATARTEFYPYPAANPEVEASSIRQDLYRRDFTINALALKLTPPKVGSMLDFFGGLYDLKASQIRVLHANSFIEDPTRIYRAVRFAVRLGFTIEPQTESYIRYALESGVYDRSQAENSKTPALQTRLKAELKYLLEAPYWKPALELIADLGALRCLHPTLKLTPQLLWQVRFLDRCLRRFDREQKLIHWQMRLEVLIAALAYQQRLEVANNLQLTVESIERLKQLTPAQIAVTKYLPIYHKPSEIFKLLRQYNLPMLVLLAVTTPRIIRKKIWQYLTQWSQVKSPLNGNDLKRMGYKPSPQYKQILEDLLMAKLDGIVSDRSEAENWLRQHYNSFRS